MRYPFFVIAVAVSAWCSPPAPVQQTAPRIDRIGVNRINFVTGAGTAYNGVVDHTETPADGVTGWVGHLENRNGAFSLIDDHGSKYARIHLPERVIRMEPGEKGLAFRVTSIDNDAGGSCATGLGDDMLSTGAATCVDSVCSQAAAAMARGRDIPGVPCNGDGSYSGKAVIKALVVFTPAVASAHSMAQIWTETWFSQIETNAAFKVSRIDAKMELAQRSIGGARCLFQVAYSESGHSAIDLSHLLTAGDGELENVERLRIECRADFVMLLLENTDSSGRSCVMTRLTHDYAPYAKAVLRFDSLPISYNFTHELGHMMGGGHDVAVCHDSLCDYSHGWHFVAPDPTSGEPTTYKTMMAYTGARALNFSDPAIHYGGPFGPRTGSADANNARTLRITRGTVAAFSP